MSHDLADPTWDEATHSDGCWASYPGPDPGDCDCHVAKVAALRDRVAELERVLRDAAVNLARHARIELR